MRILLSMAATALLFTQTGRVLAQSVDDERRDRDWRCEVQVCARHEFNHCFREDIRVRADDEREARERARERCREQHDRAECEVRFCEEHRG